MNDKKAAEKAFDKWWAKEDRYGWSLQTSWPDAYVAGMRAQRRADIKAVNALKRDWGFVQDSRVISHVIAAIQRGGK